MSLLQRLKSKYGFKLADKVVKKIKALDDASGGGESFGRREVCHCDSSGTLTRIINSVSTVKSQKIQAKWEPKQS